jgi:hypothetical protein
MGVRQIATVLARQWFLTVGQLSSLPVGFGGYHWLAVGQTGARWFVTVSDLAATGFGESIDDHEHAELIDMPGRFHTPAPSGTPRPPAQ